MRQVPQTSTENDFNFLTTRKSTHLSVLSKLRLEVKTIKVFLDFTGGEFSLFKIPVEFTYVNQ